MPANRLQAVTKLVLLISILTGLGGCAVLPEEETSAPPPKHVENLCAVFTQYPNWYREALDSYYRWKVPVSVQMAIIKYESDFQAGAKPPKRRWFGLISTSHITSAYGYAQALNDTWKEYQRETKNHDGMRDKIGDSLDFIGWYANRAHRKAGIKLNDTYHLYLAYHEGIGGYLKRTYQDKPNIIAVAKKARSLAAIYRRQLRSCKYRIATAN